MEAVVDPGTRRAGAYVCACKEPAEDSREEEEEKQHIANYRFGATPPRGRADGEEGLVGDCRQTGKTDKTSAKRKKKKKNPKLQSHPHGRGEMRGPARRSDIRNDPSILLVWTNPESQDGSPTPPPAGHCIDLESE
jgi:hypothetical protein